MHFRIINDGNKELYLFPRLKFPTIQALLSVYRNSPIRSNMGGPSEIYLLYPIPVDPVMEEKHKKMMEDKGQCTPVRLEVALVGYMYLTRARPFPS